MLNILSNPFQHLDTDDLLIRMTIVEVILAFRKLTQEALRDVSDVIKAWWKQDCSKLSIILNDIVEHESVVTMLNDIVDNSEQCEQNFVQSCFYQP